MGLYILRSRLATSSPLSALFLFPSLLSSPPSLRLGTWVQGSSSRHPQARRYLFLGCRCPSRSIFRPFCCVTREQHANTASRRVTSVHTIERRTAAKSAKGRQIARPEVGIGQQGKRAAQVVPPSSAGFYDSASLNLTRAFSRTASPSTPVTIVFCDSLFFVIPPLRTWPCCCRLSWTVGSLQGEPGSPRSPRLFSPPTFVGYRHSAQPTFRHGPSRSQLRQPPVAVHPQRRVPGLGVPAQPWRL